MSNNMASPEFRGVFIQVFRPGKPKNAKPDQAPNYSVRAAFPPTTDFSAMKAAAHEAAKYKFPEGIPKTLRSPFRRNDELDNPIDGIPDDWIIMTFTRREQDGRPLVVDENVRDIEPVNSQEVYSGAWYVASVKPYGYSNSGNKGVSFGLQGLQRVRHGDPMSANAAPASRDEFKPVSGDSGSAGGGLFD